MYDNYLFKQFCKDRNIKECSEKFKFLSKSNTNIKK